MEGYTLMLSLYCSICGEYVYELCEDTDSCEFYPFFDSPMVGD
jgi:hypothetical protein